MSDKKIIAVLGATGAQGGGVVRSILADKNGPFKARALTRDVNSEKAQALAAAGAEVVAADVDDPATLRRAFEGATAHSASPSSGTTYPPRRSWRRPLRWPRRRSTPECRTSSGPLSKTPAGSCRWKTTGCPR